MVIFFDKIYLNELCFAYLVEIVHLFSISVWSAGIGIINFILTGRKPQLLIDTIKQSNEEIMSQL